MRISRCSTEVFPSKRASARLDAETYARVKAGGFDWESKQDLFFAVWTPAREDLLVDLAGDVVDEETTLEERAAQRAERFETYKNRRAADAEPARAAVASVADGIPLGQPILVGHHSERHAPRDAERIESGMCQHALYFIERDGVLVALCANGPRQKAELRPLADYWEELPDGTFAEQGTSIQAALMVVRRC